MSERITQIPDRLYNYLVEHPGSELKPIAIAIRGKLRRNDVAYFRNVLRAMEDARTVHEEDGKWYAYEDIDFTERYYVRRHTVTREDVIECLRTCGPMTAKAIDDVLAYRTIRGSYPMLSLLIDSGDVIRVKNDKGIWLYSLAE